MRTPQSWPEGAAERWAARRKGARHPAEYQRIPGVWWRAALRLPAPQMATAWGWPVGSVRPVPADSRRPGESALWNKAVGGRHRQNLTREQEKEWLLPF